MKRTASAKIIFLVTVLLICSFCNAKTWNINDGSELSDASETNGAVLREIKEIKRLTIAGKKGEVKKRLKGLAKKYPSLSGGDFEAFVEAETYYAGGKLSKAGRKFRSFLKDYPDSPLYNVSLDRYFQIGDAFLNGYKKRVLFFLKITSYDEGVEIMDNIVDIAGDAPIAKRAAINTAEHYEEHGKFEDAYFKWSEIASLWPTGDIGKRALLAKARTKHASYIGPAYDSSALKSARSYYLRFQQRYPEEAERYEIEKKLELIDEQLAFKQLFIGKYYDRTESERAANLYHRMVVNNWPNTTSGQKAESLVSIRKEGKNEQ